MNSWLNYMVEANLCLCMVLGLYLLFLRRQTSFRVQRLVLLTGSLAAVTLPLIHIYSAYVGLVLAPRLSTGWLPEVVVNARENNGALAAHDRLWNTPLFLIYIAGCALLLMVFLIRLRKLLMLIFKSSPITYVRDGFRIIELPAPFTTFSFFRFILLGGTERLSPHDKDMMLRHELAHAKSYHSLDVLWVNLMQVFFWVNPALALYRKTFVQLHEFEADARAAEGCEVNEYCSLLAKVALESADFKLANHFSNSLIIKRINMIRMHKKSIAPWRMALLVICAIGFFSLIVSCDPTPSDDAVLDAVETPADYRDGGLDGLISFLNSNLKYPAVAVQNGTEGKVFLSFVIEKDGSVSDVTVMKGLSAETDAEAVRVTKLTKWIPGKHQGNVVRSRFVLPIKYALPNTGQRGK